MKPVKGTRKPHGNTKSTKTNLKAKVEDETPPSLMQSEVRATKKHSQKDNTVEKTTREASPERDETQTAKVDGTKLKSSKTATKSQKGVALDSKRLQKKTKIAQTEGKSENSDEGQSIEISKKSCKKISPGEKHQESDKIVKKKKKQVDDVGIKDTKTKAVKKTAKANLKTEELRGVETTEGNGVVDSKKKTKKQPKETKEVQALKIEPGISPERKRKQLAAEESVTDKAKKQKLNKEAKKRTKKAARKSPTQRGVAKKGRAKRGVSEEGVDKEAVVVQEEVLGVTEDEVKQMAKAAKFVGAHMSIAGGLDNAVKGAVATGARAFALFLRSQRQWVTKPLEDKPAEKFRQACREHNFPPHLILPHGSYLMNCGSPNDETLHKSREALADELNRCEKLGLTRYNFHPGSSCGKIPLEECLDKIGESINIVHQQTNKVMTVIENMCCQGNTVGGKFEELHGIIERVKDKSRVGVCLDTCHAFAAGFDLSSEAGYQDMMADFDRIVGFKYLVAVHLNDSKGKVGSHLDRHEKIGKGQIGLKAFQRLMNDPRFDNIPLILETPVEDGMEYATEIKLLNSLINKS